MATEPSNTVWKDYSINYLIKLEKLTRKGLPGANQAVHLPPLHFRVCQLLASSLCQGVMLPAGKTSAPSHSKAPTSTRKPPGPVCFADSSAARASSQQQQQHPPEPQYYPGFEEEFSVSQTAFQRAFQDANPSTASVPGLQQFAASIWERRRMIPSQKLVDPLLQIFDEFDHNNDGFLAAPEIASALRSRGVTITDEQVQWLINTYEKERTCALPFFAHTIARDEFCQFVYSLTISDLHVKQDPARTKMPSIDDDSE